MQLNLATKFSIIIGAVLLLAVISSALAAVTARRVAALMLQAATENVPSVRAGEELEIALLTRYNWLALYTFGDAAPEHLRELQGAREEFDRWHEEAWRTAHTAEEKQLLEQLDIAHSQYRSVRNEVVSLRGAGHKMEAETLMLGELRKLYQQVYALCGKLVAANERYVTAATAEAQSESQGMIWMVIACVALTLVLGGALLWYFLAAVVLPLRRMMVEAGGLAATGGHGAVRQSGDELKAVGAYLRGLMADVVESRSAVEDSRRRVVNAEKLAGVGKLAANVAHEIRNPLTAVKMLLFSIRRAVADDPQVDRKLQTVTDEIHRLENIVRNFLEFSKPPSLKLRRQSLREPLVQTLQLFQPQLAKNRIELVRKDADCLPDIMADSEQLKQVLLNLLQNAAEATEDGGCITVSTAVEPDSAAGSMVVVRIEDTGRGMPDDVQSRLFEPFFTTKKEGTGLGLCIASQILMGHNGRLVLESSTPKGTRFAFFIPAVQGAADEQNSRSG